MVSDCLVKNVTTNFKQNKIVDGLKNLIVF
jgi:hypothetical protein